MMIPYQEQLSDLRSPQFALQKRCNWTLKQFFFAESPFLLTYEYVQNDTAEYVVQLVMVARRTNIVTFRFIPKTIQSLMMIQLRGPLRLSLPPP